MQQQITKLYDQTDALTTSDVEVIEAAIQKLDAGLIRVCEKVDDAWVTNDWVKKAIMLYFRIKKNEVIHSGAFDYFDKIPVKKWNGTEGVRVVPQALARYGSFVEKGAILMPSYIKPTIPMYASRFTFRY